MTVTAPQPPDPDYVGSVLNEQGYPFHYAVLRDAMRTESSPFSPWLFAVSELPVAVNGKHSRIDFVLRHKGDVAFIVAECKRVNPAFTDWCFFRAPFVRRNDHQPQFWIEQWRRDPPVYQAVMEGVPKGSAKGAYHLGLSIKGKLRGDKSGGDPKDAIENTFTQVMLHVSGFAKLLSQQPGLVPYGGLQQRLIIPVVFTTAQLWTSDVDLSSADLQSGHVDPSKIKLVARPWIAYQYHTSQGIRPMETLVGTNDLTVYLVQQVIRTISLS